MTPEWLLILVGAVGGRWWADTGHGRHDAQRAWRGRKHYRKRLR